MTAKFLPLLASILLLALASCADEGDPVTTNTPTPAVTSVAPDSAKTADTVTVNGSNFGASRGSSTVAFGSTNAVVYVSWSDTQVKVAVPSGISTGATTVSVTSGGKTSNTKAFKVLASATLVKFSTDIQSLITTYGCTGCHGGGSPSGGLNLTSYANLTAGTSNHGPVVTAGNGANSVIVKKLKGTAGFGARMPASGPPYLTDAEIQKFIDWIDQGALNN